MHDSRRARLARFTGTVAYSLLVAGLGAGLLRAQTPPPGFAARSVPLPAPASGWSGLDVLPSGKLVSFDGQRIVEIDPATGQLGRTLHTLPSKVFAADVVLGPGGQHLYWCESSGGEIAQLDLTTLRSRTITTLGGCYQLGFHPREGERFLYVSALPGFTGDAKVYRVDVWSGQARILAQAKGYSGPMHFDDAGALWFAPAPTSFGTPKQAKILRWHASQVFAAIGGTALDEQSATRFAFELDGVYDLVVDGEGTFYGSDASFGTSLLFELGAAGGKGAFAGLHARSGLTFGSLLLVRGAEPFERFGTGGTLYALASDFAATHELVALTPARPGLGAKPSTTPSANTPLTVELAAAPEMTPLLWLVGHGLVPERPLLPLGVRGLAFPSFGIVPSAPFVALPALSDAKGTASLRFVVPGPSGLRFAVQALCGPISGLPGGELPSPWVSSETLHVEVR